MITKAQAGGGVAAALAVGTSTGVGVTLKNKWDESQFPPMPQFTVLSLETNFSTVYPRSSDGSPAKMGRLYRGYLTGTYGVGDNNQDDFKDNRAWWEWSYKRWERDVSKKVNLSSEFSKEKIESSFSSSTDTAGDDAVKALNKVCENLYKGELKIVAFTSSISPQERKLGNEILRYCSPLGQKPKTIEETGEQIYLKNNNSLGSKHKADLISVEDASNDIFWKLRNDDFFSNSDSHWKWSSTVGGASSKFGSLYSQGKEGSKTVKEVCGEAYSLDSSSSESLSILQYCSWNYGIIG